MKYLKNKISAFIERIFYKPIYHIMSDVLDELKINYILIDVDQNVLAYLCKNYVILLGDKIKVNGVFYVVTDRIHSSDDAIFLTCKKMEL